MANDSIILREETISPEKVESRFKESTFSYDSLDVTVTKNGKVEKKDFQIQTVRGKDKPVKIKVIKTFVERNGMG